MKMDIAALIIASMALVFSIMALPTVFQMFFGKPNFRAEFGEFRDNGRRDLRFLIWNEPITNSLLKMLGVIRTPAEVTAEFSVERLSGEIVKTKIRNYSPLISEE